MRLIMKLLVLLLLIPTYAVSSEIITMMDGSKAYCKSDYDIYHSNKQTIFSLSKPQIEKIDNIMSITVKVDFFKCAKKDGKYFFQNDLKPNISHYQIINSYGDLTYATVLTKERILRAYNEDYKVVAKSNNYISTSSRITINIAENDLVPNNFNRNGDYYINLQLASKKKYIAGENTIDWTPIYSGTFRLFIDSQELKAFFK